MVKKGQNSVYVNIEWPQTTWSQSEFLHSLFDFCGFGSFLQKSPFSFIYNFVFNLFNSFSKRTVQNPNTSDVGKHQKTQIQMILRNSNYLAILHKKPEIQIMNGKLGVSTREGQH